MGEGIAVLAGSLNTVRTMATRDIYESGFDEDVRAESSTNQCPECDGRVTTNAVETVCEDCGLVINEHHIDHGPEWRAYDDEECLPHAERAIERGAELYAGTKSREAREFFRDRLPEATIWEPQMDWMHEHSSYPKVSRLIVADRAKVVVGLWDEDADGVKTETAIVGEGTTNPLVVLVRELLGPRLDHLDYQSDEFLGSLPFES